MAAVADRAWHGIRAGAAHTEWLRLEPALPRADLPWDPSTDSSGQPEFPAGLTQKLGLSSSRPLQSISGCKQP